MNDRSARRWSQWWAGLWQKHPWLLWVLVLAVGFLTGPLMMAAGRMTAVLYKDF